MKKCSPLDDTRLAYLYVQMAQLQKAGIAPQEALQQVLAGKADKEAAARMRTALRHMRRGASVAEAGQRSGLFLGFDAALLAAGEICGEYPFEHLAESYQARVRRSRMIRSRLWLPLMVLGMALLVRPLPALVAGDIGAGAYVSSSFGVFAALLLGGYVLWQMSKLLRRIGLGALWERVALRLPWFGEIHKRRCLLEFTRTLGLLVQAGVPVFEALPKAVATLPNRVLQQRLACVEDALHRGASVGEALSCAEAFDPHLLTLVRSGEHAGSLDGVLLHYARLEEETVSAHEESLARWLPRVVYALVAGWMIASLLGDGLPGSLEALREMEESEVAGEEM